MVCRGLSEAVAAPGRLEPVDGPQAFRVLVDYAHTEDALERVLLTLRTFSPATLRLVMGCGGDRDAGKRPRMGRVAARLADHTYVTSDNPRGEDPGAIISDIVRGFPASASFVVEPDRRAAITAAIGDAGPGDIVLIAGKGHESSQIIGDRTLSFDDRIVAREILELLAGERGWPEGRGTGVLA
jgi:UDP-N-acetylmuramoyl-L-alanyl-D-glutamate--2,6-diaminopimelate ligase